MASSALPLPLLVIVACPLLIGGICAVIWPSSRFWRLGRRRPQVHSWNAWAYDDIDGKERSSAGKNAVRVIGAVLIVVAIAMTVTSLIG